jgi:hypothetical protein
MEVLIAKPQHIAAEAQSLCFTIIGVIHEAGNI